jgi:hypothetical protein
MSNIYSLPQVPLVDVKGNMSAQWQGYFTALNRALNALGGIPPTPTSTPVLAAAYKGAWISTTTYFPGDEISYGGNVFRALLENLNVTPANGAYWLLIGPLTLDWLANGGTYSKVLASRVSNGVPYNYQGAWNSAANYVKGDEVSYSGNYWLAVANNTNQAPPSASWQILGPVNLDNVTDGSTYSRVLGAGLTSGVVNTAGLVANSVTAVTLTTDDSTYYVNNSSPGLNTLYPYASAAAYISSPVLTFTPPQNATIISTLTTNVYMSCDLTTNLVADCYVFMALLDTTAGIQVDYTPQSGTSHNYNNYNAGPIAANGISPTSQLTFQMENNVTAGHVYKLYLLCYVSQHLTTYFTSTQMQFENIQR